MGSDPHEGSVKFSIKWGAGVVANESAEGCIGSSGAAAIESIPEKASPAYSLTRPCEPLVDGPAVELWRFLHSALDGTRRIRIVEVVK